ncbi:hypothetical protein [Pseudorhodoferax sp. Leaf267]|uniref:hypothetical protein n=1 Tax=Pseudorhodoferax sp. Leaf267 TaxID=1736316 RepID=UPI0012E1B690|nr:hypothetical protein [Pseudorhodoferax sp. Leaf267]
MDDIQNSMGSGKITLSAIQKVESGKSQLEELSGNAWSMYISAGGVWFEGYYDQGEGGKVSLGQFKIAVQTYVDFLFDPEHRKIDVEFPEQ